MSFFNELKRRNVFRVGAAYIVTAWIIIQVVETLFPIFDFSNESIRITVVVLAIGLIPVLFFAWAFELTPQGLKREKDVVRDHSITPQTGKKLDRWVIVALAFALAYFAFDKFVLSPAREVELVESTAQIAEQAILSRTPEKSIAVLPFVNMSSDPEQEYFADGITEEILNVLSKIDAFSITGRTSSFAFKGRNEDLRSIGEALNVAHVLEGSVRRSGNQLRITAQLIKVDDGYHLWSETYDRNLEDVFAIQDEISSAVAAQLKVELLGVAPTVRKMDVEAYSLYLQARYLKNQNRYEDWDQVIELLQQSLKIEPNNPSAWTTLGWTYADQVGRGIRPREEGMQLALDAVNKAVAIDPDDIGAHMTLGWFSLFYENDLAAAARYFETGLALEPADLGLLNGSSVLLKSLGRLEEANSVQQFIVARDPINISALGNLGWSYIALGLADEALAVLNTLRRLAPGNFGLNMSLATALLLKDEPQAALETSQIDSHEPSRLIGLAMAHHALGHKLESDAALAELIDKHETGWSYNIAYVFAYRGETNQAFDWLDKAVEYKDSGLAEIPTTIEFASIRDDARWLPFLESLGKSPAQLGAIKFDVKLPGEGG